MASRGSARSREVRCPGAADPVLGRYARLHWSISDAEMSEVLLRDYLDEADAVIAMPMPIGRGNIGNIRVLLEYAEKTILVAGEPGSGAMEDFTGGDARALLDELEARGAARIRGLEDLAARLASL